MNNYQNLCNNLKVLKLNQISINLDEYIDKVNEGKISIVDALYELTSKEIEVKNFNTMVKVAGFPHLKELKDFDFQPKINKQQFLDFEDYQGFQDGMLIFLHIY